VTSLAMRPAEECRWDLVSLGEVMLRLDPGDGRISTSRSFRVWEGGGEYNVAKGLGRCFGKRAAIVTALADNAVGRLIEDLVYQGGVERAQVNWVPYDGIGRSVRNGLNFTERGYGVRAALGVSDRANTAASQLAPGDVDWEQIFAQGVRWFHTGGIFCALSATTADIALEAIQCARRHGTIVSYDLNYRPSLWRAIGGERRAAELNRRIAQDVDVLFGGGEDYSTALGFRVPDLDGAALAVGAAHFDDLLNQVLEELPRVRLAAATLRRSHTATRNDWTAVCRSREGFYVGPRMCNLEIYDRVGGGDAFASGFLFGLLSGLELERSLGYGVAHGALAMTTPGDTSMATLTEVERVLDSAGARADR
jgi:2-dehydro-3-deoxygluconokinase